MTSILSIPSSPPVSPSPRSDLAIAQVSPASDLDFAAILSAARKGESISDAQQYAWSQHKMAIGDIGHGPDEVEMAGMLKGFKMEFPDGFPADLRQRLEQTYTDCKTVKDRYQFMNMYAGNFNPSIAKVIGFSWGSDWQERLKYTIKANEALAGGLSPTSAKGTRESDVWLQRLLDAGLVTT